MVDLGLLVLRVVLGLMFIGHGSQKLFGLYGGAGLNGTIKWIGSMGLRPAWFWGLVASLSEFGGGVLLLLGLFTPLGSLGIIAAMLVAIVQVHWSKGFWNTKGGIEFPLTNIAGALTLALTGPGKYSLDSVFHVLLPEPITLIVGLILIVLGVIVSQLTRSKGIDA